MAVSMEPWPVSMMTSTEGGARGWLQRRQPVHPGSRRSSSTISGSCRASCAMASSPKPAVDNVVAQAPQFAGHDVAESGVVVHQQDGSRAFFMPRTSSRQHDFKRRAAARLALHADVSAPAAHEIQRQEQAQAVAALAAR